MSDIFKEAYYENEIISYELGNGLTYDVRGEVQIDDDVYGQLHSVIKINKVTNELTVRTNNHMLDGTYVVTVQSDLKNVTYPDL